jgi:Spy/CpxP family protein refolding chaperone
MNCRRRNVFWILLALIAAFAVAAPVIAEPGETSPKLNLSESQRQKLRDHITESRAKMAGARGDLRNARMDLFGQLSHYKLDDKRVAASVNRINTLQRRLLQISYENQVDLRKILTRQQFEQLGQAVGEHGPGKRGPGGPGEAWGAYGLPQGADIKKLDLSEDQQKQIARLFDKSSGEVRSLSSKLRTEMGSLRKLYLDYDLDQKRVNSQIDRVGDAERNLLNETVSRQKQLRKILNEDQFNTLAKSMKPPQGGPRGRGRGH